MSEEYDFLPEPVALVHSSVVGEGIENVLLVDSDVSDSLLFYDSSNASTFPVIYSTSSCKKDLLALLQSNFTSIKRLAFIFHDLGPFFYNTFLDKHFLFTANDILETCTAYSENMQLLIDLIKQYNIQNIDFLACNTLQYSNWVAFYEIIRKETGVIVGASNDKTGNIQYGGDWLLECTNTDIISTYFSNESGLTSYTGTLAISTISASTTLNNTSLNNGTYNWPITINGGTAAIPTVITFSDDITLSGFTGQYFLIGSEYVTINGGNKTVTILNIASYPGLIKNGDYVNYVFGYSNTTITNINITNSGTSSQTETGGWICQAGYGSGAINNIISYCNSSATIRQTGCGGIVGGYVSSRSGSLIIRNCSNSGGITGGFGPGGICGNYLGQNRGFITLTNCFNTGIISAGYGGGICGAVAGQSNATVNIKNCYNTGNITSNQSGGIAGQRFGEQCASCTITNCYNSGLLITGSQDGGIVGPAPNEPGPTLINNCYMYSSGNIMASVRTNIVITNCYIANSSWTDTEAKSTLLGAPTGVNSGSVWTSTSINTPYVLSVVNTISTSTILNNTNLNDGLYTWPITINGGTASVPTVITFSENITLSTDANQYFIIGSQYVTIDGGNKTVTISNIGGYLGLIKNGDFLTPTFGYSNTTITNINITNFGTSNQSETGGWICQAGYGCKAINNVISYCNSSATIMQTGCGGIVGGSVGSKNGVIIIKNCSNSGNINGGYGPGGICGNYLGQEGGSVTLTNCFNTGIINAGYGGGICGAVAGRNLGTIYIKKCYNTGNITSNQSGGIAGQRFGDTCTRCTITNSYSTGLLITGSQDGGISGPAAGTSGPVLISNCYMYITGNIIPPTSDSNIVITNCYIANSSWLDTTANSILLGTPTGVTSGTLWTSTATDTPYILSADPPEPTIPESKCFLEGTQILCFVNDCEQYIPIEHITTQNFVKTTNDGYKKVTMICNAKIYNSGDNRRTENRLYLCSKNTYHELKEDLIITGFHSILVDDFSDEIAEKTTQLLGELFITDNKLRLIACLDDRAVPYDQEGTFNIWHFALEHTDCYMNYGVYANGLLVESCSEANMGDFLAMVTRL